MSDYATSGEHRAVICTALPVEYLAVRAYLKDLREVVHPQGTIYEQGKFSAPDISWQVRIVEIGAGNANAALETERALSDFAPHVVCFVGVAGGLKDVQLGDVVAATKVYGYESGKADKSFLTRPEVGNSTHRMVQRARAEARKDDWLDRLKSSPSAKPHVFVAPIAAGEKVLSSTRVATWNFLKQHYGDALAVEMEGYGFMRSAQANHSVEALIIRGISDLVYNKTEADAHKFQEIASAHASAFAFEVLAKLAGTEFADIQQQQKTQPSSSSSGSRFNNQIQGNIGKFFQGDHAIITINDKEEK